MHKDHSFLLLPTRKAVECISAFTMLVYLRSTKPVTQVAKHPFPYVVDEENSKNSQALPILPQTPCFTLRTYKHQEYKNLKYTVIFMLCVTIKQDSVSEPCLEHYLQIVICHLFF